jgi:hypothetical protein
VEAGGVEIYEIAAGKELGSDRIWFFGASRKEQKHGGEHEERKRG